MESTFIFHPHHPQVPIEASPFGTKAFASVSTASNQPEPAQSRFIKHNKINTNQNPHTRRLTKDKIPCLQAHWIEEILDIMGLIPLQLPPLCEVNHFIQLIDPSKPIKHWYSKCPDSLHLQLMEKIECYTAAGWWEDKLLGCEIIIITDHHTLEFFNTQ
jgi:hypothetical protein